VLGQKRDNVQEEIRGKLSPLVAKRIAKRERAMMVVEPMSEQDLDNMEMVLRLKLEQHPELKKQLLNTSNKIIIEDCSSRPRGSGLYWGAALEDGRWVGNNVLGKLWMKLREELKGQKREDHSCLAA
jgi:predicted NAD-dependent protein-ADP-ribosyltransferase YbiA (DUF1768 family)